MKMSTHNTLIEESAVGVRSSHTAAALWLSTVSSHEQSYTLSLI